MPYLQIVGGLVLLGVGGEAIVRGAIRLSGRLRISPLLVGLFIVALGTSSPELAVSIHSVLQGKADLAVGNVIGSNISNLLFVLPMGALVFPIVCYRSVLQRDLVVMLATTGFLIWLSSRGVIGSLQGMFLLSLLGLYILYAFLEEKIRQAPVGTLQYNMEIQLEGAGHGVRSTRHGLGFLADFAWLAGGATALYFGSRFLVDGAVEVAFLMGISQAMIGLSVVAVGTSLPELATVMVASWRKQPEVAVGGIIGSNIFNSLAVLGATTLAAPVIVNPTFVSFDMWIMLGASLLVIPFMLTEWRITRIEAVILLGSYAAYIYALYNHIDFSIFGF